MTDNPPLIHLSAPALESLDVAPPAVADAIGEALRAVGEGRAWSVPKASIVPGPGRLFQAMLAASESPAYAMVKAVGLSALNSARGLPHIGSTLTLLDGETGLPLAILDGAWVTGVRTAAISALAARHLAVREVRSIAFVGCGEQARRHLAAFVAEHAVERVLAVSRTLEGARHFARWAAERFGVNASAHDDPRAAVADADVVVTSVPEAQALEPFLDPAWVRPGGFVAACDLARPWRRGLAGFDLVVVDDRAQDAASGHPLVPVDAVTADLYTLAAGASPARTGDAERAALVFRGLAIGDLAAARLAYERACERGTGIALGR